MKRLVVALTVLAACTSPTPAPTGAHEQAPKVDAPEPTIGDQVADKLASGELAHGLSEPEELETLLGAPIAKMQGRDGGLITLRYTYDNAEVVYSRRANTDTPFVLSHIVVQGRELPEPAMLVLRNLGGRAFPEAQRAVGWCRTEGPPRMKAASWPSTPSSAERRC